MERTLRAAKRFLMLAAAALAAAMPGQLQASTMQLYGRTLALSPEELRRLTDLGRLVYDQPGALQKRALEAARNISNSPDARFVLAVYELEIGRRQGDDGLRAKALDVLIASPFLPAARLPDDLGIRGSIAFKFGDLAAAETAWQRLLTLRPNDAQALFNLGQLRLAQGNQAAAVALIAQAIAARPNGTEPAPEAWYRQWLAVAHSARLEMPSMAAAHALVAVYPTKENWHFALVAIRQLVEPHGDAELDLFRLTLAANGFTKPAEYQRMAQLLGLAGLADEGQAVLAAGARNGVLDRATSPTLEIARELDRAQARERRGEALVDPAAGDRLLAQGRPADAVAAYRAAVEQNPSNPVAALRLAVAIAQSGDRAEAITLLRALATISPSDPAARIYPELARFRLALLEHGPPPA